MEQNPGAPLLDFSVTPDMSGHLRETARWTRFLSIVSIIALVLVILGVAIASTTMSELFAQILPGTDATTIKGIFFGAIAVVLAIGCVLVFFLFRFSADMKRAIELNDHGLFSKALRSLKIYFIVYGVLAILSLLGNISTIATLY